jgi:hypothetical protein
MPILKDKEGLRNNSKLKTNKKVRDNGLHLSAQLSGGRDREDCNLRLAPGKNVRKM